MVRKRKLLQEKEMEIQRLRDELDAMRHIHQSQRDELAILRKEIADGAAIMSFQQMQLNRFKQKLEEQEKRS